MQSPDQVQASADALRWFHSIELGDGVVTHGTSDPAIPDRCFPDFAGKRVLDIGAWDGYYSFMAERKGATQVVALDHYAWGLDFEARGAYWNECFATGSLPDQSRDLTEFWRADLPGRRGFEFAAAALGSSVEPVVADFATADLGALGTFDVVLYLGVLYHMKEPLTCLERLRSVTTGVAVIETEAVHFQNLEHESLVQFYAGGDLHSDFGNWFIPTLTGLHSLCLAAGFSSVRTEVGPPGPAAPLEPLRSRLGRWVGGERRGPISPPSCRYRAVVHASA